MKQFPAPTPNYPKGSAAKNTGPDLLSHHEQTLPRSQFNYLQIMGILIDIEFKLAGNESFAAVAIKQAIRDKKPARVILDTIRDMATDNFNGVADMIGVKLTNKILAI